MRLENLPRCALRLCFSGSSKLILTLAVAVIVGSLVGLFPLWGSIVLACGVGLVAFGLLTMDCLLALFFVIIPFSARLPVASAPLDIARLLFYALLIRALMSRGRIRKLPARFGVLALSLLGWGSLTAVTGIDPANSIRKMYNIFSFVLVFWGIIHLVHNEKRVKLVARYSVLAGIILSSVALWQFIAGAFVEPLKMKEIYLKVAYVFEGPNVFARAADWPVHYFANWYSTSFGLVRATGTSMSPMALAQILLLSFFPLLTLALIQRKRRRRWLLILAAMIEGIAIFVTLSRGAWLSLGVGSIVVLLSILLRNIRVSKRTLARVLGLGILLMSTAAILAPNRSAEAFAQAVKSVFVPRASTMRQFEASNEARFQTYKVGVDTIKQHPLLGVGPGNFAQEAGYSAGGSTHNVYLNVAAEMGVMGMVLYVAILLSGCLAFWWVSRRSTNMFYSALATGWLASLAALMVYWNFTAYFFEPKLGMMLWSVLAMSVVLQRLSQRVRGAS